MEKTQQAWEKSPLEIEIIESFDAKIVSIEKDRYGIEFYDDKLRLVEGFLSMKEFENWPHSIAEGTCFGIIAYKENGKVIAEAWPIHKYWSPELLQRYVQGE